MLHKAFSGPVWYLVTFFPMLGHACIGQTDKGICALFWRHEKETLEQEIEELFPQGRRDAAPFARLAKEELSAYCEGRLQNFSVPLDLHGTSFRQRVWEVLLSIPYGRTLSYYDVACAVENPKGVRAVAQACGANPVSILVPCHRVIGKNGNLTGYTGGLDYKRRLLELEGVSIQKPSTRRPGARQVRLL